MAWLWLVGGVAEHIEVNCTVLILHWLRMELARMGWDGMRKGQIDGR
jgi:hypothetical protein